MVKGHVDDVYMEAKTINLANVTFPKSAVPSEIRGRSHYLHRFLAGAGKLRNVNPPWIRHSGVVGSGVTSSPKMLEITKTYQIVNQVVPTLK